MFPGKYQFWNFLNIFQAHQRRNRDPHKQQQKKLSPYQLKNWYSSLSLPKNISKHVKTRHADLVYFLLTGSTHEKKFIFYNLRSSILKFLISVNYILINDSWIYFKNDSPTLDFEFIYMILNQLSTESYLILSL